MNIFVVLVILMNYHVTLASLQQQRQKENFLSLKEILVQIFWFINDQNLLLLQQDLLTVTFVIIINYRDLFL